MTELALIIILSTAVGGLIMAIATVAREAWQTRLDHEFYAGYMHGLSKQTELKADHILDSMDKQATNGASNGKEVMRIGVHRP